MEQDRITNSQVSKKKKTTFAIYYHFRARNKPTKPPGFSKNIYSDSVSLSRHMFNEVSLKFLSFQMSYIRKGGAPPHTHFKCKTLTVYKNEGPIVKTF